LKTRLLVRGTSRIAAAAVAGLLLAALAGQAAAEEAEVYRWVDSNGVVHYSDVPIEGAVATGIRSERTDPRQLREQQLRQWEQDQKQSEQDAIQTAENQAAAARRAEAEADKADRCVAARERAASYATAHRLFEPLPNGERRYLTAEETTAARTAAEAEVAEWCE
jgi:hypothetical protein